MYPDLLMKDDDGLPLKVDEKCCMIAGGIGNTFGIINEDDEILFPFEYIYIDAEEKNGYRVIRDSETKCGAINSSLEIVQECVYDFMVYNDNGVAFANKDDNAYLIKPDGERLSLGKKGLFWMSKGEYFRLTLDGKVGWVDEYGNWAIPDKYSKCPAEVDQESEYNHTQEPETAGLSSKMCKFFKLTLL